MEWRRCLFVPLSSRHCLLFYFVFSQTRGIVDAIERVSPIKTQSRCVLLWWLCTQFGIQLQFFAINWLNFKTNRDKLKKYGAQCNHVNASARNATKDCHRSSAFNCGPKVKRFWITEFLSSVEFSSAKLLLWISFLPMSTDRIQFRQVSNWCCMLDVAFLFLYTCAGTFRHFNCTRLWKCT